MPPSPSSRTSRVGQFLGEQPTNTPKTVRPRAIRRGDVRRVDVDQDHFELLQEIAGLTAAFMPVLERAGAPVMQPGEFERLRADLATLVERFGEQGVAISDIVGILNDLR